MDFLCKILINLLRLYRNSQLLRVLLEGKITITKLLIIALFFLSGFCALTYEIVWQRIFVQITGATALATTTVLCLFMSGIGLGAIFYSLLRKRIINGLLFFAGCEALIGVFGFASCFLNSPKTLNTFLELGKTVQSFFPGDFSTSFPYFVTFSILLLPTMAMGATLPAIARFLNSQIGLDAKFLSLVYLSNTLGGVFATLFSGLFLLPLLGIKLTLVLTAVTNSMVFLFALFVGKSVLAIDKKTTNEQTEEPFTSYCPSQVKAIVSFVCVSISGATFMAMEVIWARYLVVLFGTSTYSISFVLAFCLMGISIGTLIINKSSKWHNKGVNVYAALFFLCTFALALCIHLYNHGPFLYLSAIDFFANSLTLSESITKLLAMLIITMIMVMPASIALGAVFPFALIDQGYESKDLSKATARLLALNILGTVAGAFSMYVLFDRDLTHIIESNIQTGTLWLTLLCLVLATVLIFIRFHYKRDKELFDGLVLAALFASAGLLIFRPNWNPNLMSYGYSFIPAKTLASSGVASTIKSLTSKFSNERSFFYREAANAIVTVKRDKNNNVTKLTNNGKVEAAIPISRRAPSPWTDLPTHTLMGLSGTILCPNDNQDSLVVGYGSGTTCGTNLVAGWLNSLTVVELDEAVYSIDPYFQPSNLSPLKSSNLNSGKVVPIVADARTYLASTQKTYDTIISQPAEPWITGSSSLYTKEFFDLASSKLKEKGIFCQWLQLYAISKYDLTVLLKTFNQSFTHSFIMKPKNAGEIILLGKNDSDKFSKELIDKRFLEPGIKEVLNQIGIKNQADFFAQFIYYPANVKALVSDKSIKLNTDDNLFIEFHMANNASHSEKQIEELSALLCKSDGINLNTICDHLDKSHQELLSHICLAIAKTRFSSYRPYTDIQLCKWFGVVSVQDKLIDCPFALDRIKKLLKTIETDTTYGASLKQITSARIYQELHNKTNEASLSTFLEDYQTIKSKVSLQSENSFMNSQLAMFWLNEKNKNLARKFALKVNNQNSSNAYELYNAGLVLLSLEEYSEAISRLQKASVFDPVNSAILSSLAVSRSLNGAPDKLVVNDLIKSLALDPNQYIPRYLLGQLYFKSGKLSLCLFEMHNASKVSFTDASAHIFVTAAFNKIHHFANARKNLSVLKSIKPNSPFAKTLELSIIQQKSEKKSDRKKIQNELENLYGIKLSMRSIDSINNLILESPVPKLLFSRLEKQIAELKLERSEAK